MRLIERRITDLEEMREAGRPTVHVIPGFSEEEREASRRVMVKAGVIRRTDLVVFIRKGLASEAA